MFREHFTPHEIPLSSDMHPVELPPAAQALAQLGIPHRLFQHAGAVNSLEQAAVERNQLPEQIVRSLLFRIKTQEYVMVLVAGPGQIAWSKLRQHLGQSRLTMATPDEVHTVTGYEVGAVAPFGMPTALPILVDKSVLAQREVSIGSGRRGTAILLTTKHLMQALGEAHVGRFRA